MLRSSQLSKARSVVNEIPQGMWMYLLGLIWGTGVLTWSLLKLREESKAQDSDPYPHINTI